MLISTQFFEHPFQRSVFQVGYDCNICSFQVPKTELQFGNIRLFIKFVAHRTIKNLSVFIELESDSSQCLL